jgi:hypothetical protein
MILGTAATTVTGGTYGAVKATKATSDNLILVSTSILNSTNQSGPNSPSGIIGGVFIQSPNESEIPLLSMLDSLLIFNCLELSLMISILVILFRVFINPKLKFLILRILSYFVKNKVELSDKEVKINSIINASAKYSNYAIALLLITLILLKITNLFFLFYLNENIDSFIIVYNIFKQSSFYVLLSLKKDLKNQHSPHHIRIQSNYHTK